MSPTPVRDTVLLQCLAALLIANSHLEALWPRPWMAADGLLGNSMFFFLSGYGLVKSELANHRPFGPYYGRRIARIYPALWLTVIILQVAWEGAWRNWRPPDYFNALVYPTGYGYIRLIMIYYLPVFWLARRRKPALFPAIAAALLPPYAVIYVCTLPAGGLHELRLGTTSDWLWMIFYFQMVLIGGYAGFHKDWRLLSRQTHAVLLLLAGCILYVGLKFAMYEGWNVPGSGMGTANFYFLLIILTALIVSLACQVLSFPAVRNALALFRPVNWLVGLAGGLTLEIYLTHEYVARSKLITQILFPFNLLVFWVLTLLVSWLVAKMAVQIRALADRVASKLRKKIDC